MQRPEASDMDTANKQIEQQITLLLRRVQRIHLSTTTGEVNLERSAYGIMCKLADEGPQRLGALAVAFGLDPSTITRQVQALEEIGLAARKTDPTDRRASILDLTDSGHEVLDSTRARRRTRLQQALSDWPESDLSDFGRLLKEFNASLDRLLEESGQPR
jgi:DNA-binding MarR family transcriptional regulator